VATLRIAYTLAPFARALHDILTVLMERCSANDFPVSILPHHPAMNRRAAEGPSR